MFQKPTRRKWLITCGCQHQNKQSNPETNPSYPLGFPGRSWLIVLYEQRQPEQTPRESRPALASLRCVALRRAAWSCCVGEGRDVRWDGDGNGDGTGERAIVSQGGGEFEDPTGDEEMLRNRHGRGRGREYDRADVDLVYQNADGGRGPRMVMVLWAQQPSLLHLASYVRQSYVAPWPGRYRRYYPESRRRLGL